MTRLIFVLLALVFAPSALAAQPAHYAYIQFDLPDGWIRLDETQYGAFASPDGALTVSLVARLGDDDAEDTLEAFVARAETDETVERGEPQQLSDDPIDVWRQETTATAKDGRLFRRLYTSAAPGDVATVIVVSGEPVAWAAHGEAARALLASLRLTAPNAAERVSSALEEQPGEGGLDGVYVAKGKRDALAAGKLAWGTEDRIALLYFDPLGDVYRGPASLFDVAAFDRCDGDAAWRCGRYRIEGNEIALRWRDGTTERRAFARSESGLTIGAGAYRAADLTGVPGPSGAFVLKDVFNQAYPQAVVRFLEDGKFVLEGVDSLRRPAFGEGRTAAGKFRLASRTMTLVYANGASEVVGFARLPSDEGSEILLGGMLFAAP
jgi:hypothetical protein